MALEEFDRGLAKPQNESGCGSTFDQVSGYRHQTYHFHHRQFDYHSAGNQPAHYRDDLALFQSIAVNLRNIVDQFGLDHRQPGSGDARHLGHQRRSDAATACIPANSFTRFTATSCAVQAKRPAWVIL